MRGERGDAAVPPSFAWASGWARPFGMPCLPHIGATPTPLQSVRVPHRLPPIAITSGGRAMLRDRLLRPFVAAGLVVAALASFASPSLAAEATPVASPVASPVAVGGPAAACKQAGGIVRERTPMLGTNPPSTQITLGGARAFCEFTHGEGSDDDSWIAIDLDSLVSPEPTLAVLAYLTKPALPENTGSANPASIYCAHLGGAEIGAQTGAGGGWVTTDTDTPIDVLQACVFGDGSIIDSWGITYHANGIVRGADLTGTFAYQSANPPHVFPAS